MNNRRRVSARSTCYERLPLTEREHEILELAGQGLSVKGTAQTLGISPGTVTWHLKNSYLKLGASSREDALKKARAEKLIDAGAICEVCACAIDSQTWRSRGRATVVLLNS
jgi:DNA-binding CsgD family transcriptional regulator